MSTSIRNVLRGRAMQFGVAALLSGTVAGAQEYDSLAIKYKKEDAVVTDYTEHLVITAEGTGLAANSYYTRDKLFISNLSRGVHNNDYFYRSDFHRLTDRNATLMLPQKDGGYKKVPCYNFFEVNPDRDNVFYDDNRLVVVSYSGLVKNAVTHTTYTLEHTDMHLLPSFTFQEDIPVDKATYQVTAPKWVDMGFVLTGDDTGRIQRTVEEGVSTVTYRFTVKNVKACKEQTNVPSYLYYITQVVPYIRSYKMPASARQVDMLGNTDQLYKYMYKFVRNLNMKTDTLLDNTVAEITKDDVTPADKARHIYQWVQQNMHYIAFEKGLEGFVPRDASLVLRRRYGDCKDMTAILVTMCQRAGLDAHYVWIGTREKPYFYGATPLPLVSDHMIAAVKINNEWTFMDGTHPFIPYGQNPDMIQGKEALIAIDEKNYKIIAVPVAEGANNMVEDSTMMTFDNRRVTGTVKQRYTGYEAWSLGAKKMYLKGDDWSKMVRGLTARGSDKYHYTKDVVHTGRNSNKDATVETEFTLDDYVNRAGRQCFVNMNMKHTFEDKRIDTEGRTAPCYYSYKHKTREVVVLDLPKGYKVAHLPASAQGSVDGLWSYKITYKADKQKVTLTKEYELSTLAASPKLFAANNKMVDDLKKLYKKSVVLTTN